MTSTIDPQEVEKFSRIADEWWSETGKFKPLHKFNPIRISFIRGEIERHFGEEILKQVQDDVVVGAGTRKNFSHTEHTLRHPELVSGSLPLSNLKILDVGCGGGLIAEPFAKMGASVTAIDASEKNIAVAKIHAEKSGLKIDYRVAAAEELTEQFDVVFALEIIEHVADAEIFVKNLAKLVKPNGLVFVATMNRTLKSLALAKFAVEYVLRWLPAGTHDWKKFLKPSEINACAASQGLNLKTAQGFGYNIFKDEWKETSCLEVNYAVVFVREC